MSTQDETAEQPRRVADLIARHDEIAALTQRLQGRFSSIHIVARGSSDNVARYAQYVFGARHDMTVTLAAPSLHTRYGARPDLRGALVIGISQSGASPDVAAVLATARAQNVPSLAITNVADSPLAQAADEVIDLGVGPELAVAATKTYTSSLAAIAMLSAALAGDGHDDLARVPAAMQEVLSVPVPAELIAPWVSARRGIVVGRGYEFATAHEVALKLQELARVIAQAHSAADVRHGPIGGLEAGVPVLVTASHGALSDDLVTVAAQLRDRGAPVAAIGSLALDADASWRLPALPEWVMPLVTVVAGQRLAVALALASGLDPDRPAGLTKVTRTL